MSVDRVIIRAGGPRLKPFEIFWSIAEYPYGSFYWYSKISYGRMLAYLGHVGD